MTPHLLSALRPFVEACAAIERDNATLGRFDDDAKIVGIDWGITVGDLRRAKAAYEAAAWEPEDKES